VTLKAPSVADHVFHDKYSLAEEAIRVAVASCVNKIEAFHKALKTLPPSDAPKSPPQLDIIKAYKDLSRPVTLRLVSTESTKFVKKTERLTGGDKTLIVENQSTGMFGTRNSITSTKVKQKVTDYHWQTTTSFTLSIFSGTDITLCTELSASNVGTDGDKYTTLCRVDGSVRSYSTTTSDNPRAHKGNHTSGAEEPKKFTNLPHELDISWLFQSITYDGEIRESTFKIDRDDAETCITPCNNPAV